MNATQRVPPLNLTFEERRTLLHCIQAGERAAIEHFGDDEAKRIDSIKEKLDFPVRDRGVIKQRDGGSHE